MVAQSVHVAPRGLWEVVLAGSAALCICLGTPASPLWEPQSSQGRSLCGASFSFPPEAGVRSGGHGGRTWEGH